MLPAGFLPPGAAACLGLIEELTEPLAAAELPGTDRMAPVRLREFIAGRTAARRALHQLTGEWKVVPRREDRAPAWPEGCCGSISHSRRFAVAVVASLSDLRAIGVDIEEEARLTPDLWPSTLGEDELRLVRGLPPADAVGTATLLFSAKEAVYKCLSRAFAAAGALPEPDRIGIGLDFGSAALTCSVSALPNLPRLRGRFTRFAGHWITLFAETPFAASGSSSPSGKSAGEIDIPYFAK